MSKIIRNAFVIVNFVYFFGTSRVSCFCVASQRASTSPRKGSHTVPVECARNSESLGGVSSQPGENTVSIWCRRTVKRGARWLVVASAEAAGL